MNIQQYSVQAQQISNILAWVRSGEIAIPEIQRPFVWDATHVRNFLDSLYNGYPVGYLIAWRNPNVKLKDGSFSEGKKILIDGQQRVTALMAAILGQEVLTKDYRKIPIVIAFNPLGDSSSRFEVSNSAIKKNPQWIPDISVIFSPEARTSRIVRAYMEKNPHANEDDVEDAIERLRLALSNNTVGYIELSSDLDIETVTEIFIRVNSAGVSLSQADFAMSKIAVNETYSGNILRKTIDYFCHLMATPEFYGTLKESDKEFAQTDFYRKMEWIRSNHENIYKPSYVDMLRVAFSTRFKRGKLADLVALLSGRNFETKQYEERIVEESFGKLNAGTADFINETHFKRFVMIIKGAGFIDLSFIGSQNALNFAYILYLTLRQQGYPAATIEHYVAKWFIYSVLVGRYSAGSPETDIHYDIERIDNQGIEKYAADRFNAELSDIFWDSELPQRMNTSVSSSPYFRLFRAAQVKANDKGFLSRDITVRDLILNRYDVHHLFPRQYLEKNGLTRGQYNQIANYAVTQSEINISIGKKEPFRYMSEIREQCSGGQQKYGHIRSMDELRENLIQHCIPEDFEFMDINNYQDFLAKRRKLMAWKIRDYFYSF
ncbi:DUF262 domain-containing protein [Oxalobacter aliiformigenes]|uniref:GmrSD restriction endonuclease domain-containing protein n=1 Tax=Oxalobacter aliiformigenes TaxID=2946593 RepID=UPI0022AEBB6C|nr:DUF262 domain-containing protein [Oxalobacter aliiformigenes]WAV89937.1 DUF262 domain-containing protein [Oxalobacter aliiformigenes]